MSFVIEVSIGIAMFPDDATADEMLMQRADVAMYVAKQRRSGVERYEADLDRNSPARLALFRELRRGLDRGDLELHYQPMVYLADRRAAGVEALVRWRHPVRGMLTPADFLPVVQQSYLMREVTAFVIETAVAQAALWRQAGFDLQVSINVSGDDQCRVHVDHESRLAVGFETSLLYVQRVRSQRKRLKRIKSLPVCGLRCS